MNPIGNSLEIQPDVRLPLAAGFERYESQASPARPEGVGLLEAVRRHWFLILIFLGAGVGAGLAYITVARPVYNAATSIRIDQKKEGSPVLDAFLRELSASDVFTEQAALGSRTLIEAVTDSLALRVTLKKPVRVSRSDVFSFVSVSKKANNGTYRLQSTGRGMVTLEDTKTNRVLGIFSADNITTPDGLTLALSKEGVSRLPVEFNVDGFSKTVERVSRGIKVERPDRDANVIVLRYKDTDSVLVRDVPNAIAVNFINNRRIIQKTAARSTVAFIRAQLDTVNAQLAQSEAELSDFRSSQQVVDLTAEADARVRHLSDLEAQRNELNSEKVALQNVIFSLHQQSLKNPDKPAPYGRLAGFPTLFRSQAVGGILQSLNEVQNQRSALLTKRTMKDSEVRVLTQRIEELQHELESIAETYLDGLGQQVAALDATRKKAGDDLASIPARQIRNTQLERKPTVLDGMAAQLQQRLRDAQIAEAVEDPSVRVLDAAVLPLGPYSPKPMLVIPSAIMATFCLGLLIAWLLERRDRAIHTRRHLLYASGLPVLAAIPRMHLNRWRNLLPTRTSETNSNHVIVDPRGWSLGLESYRVLRTNLSVHQSRGAKTMVITSPLPGEGKTLTATNLAISLARQGSRVLLIDADLRRGTIASLFGVSAKPGLAEILRGDTIETQGLRTVQLGQNVQLDVVVSGEDTPYAAELLQGPIMRAFVAQMREKYDFVLIDCPPINVVADSAIVSPLVDGVLLVARAGVTTPDTLTYAIEQLHMAGNPNILGTVLNDVDFSRDTNSYGSPAWAQYARQLART